MKSSTKAIIAGVVITVIGVFILLIALGLNGWSFYEKFEMKKYTQQSEITTLQVEFSAGSLKMQYYDKDEIYVEYPENNSYGTTFTEKDGKLSIKFGQRHWYDFTFFMGNIPKAVIYIPENTALKLDLQVNAGAVEIGEMNFTDVKTQLNAGALKFNGLNCDKFNLEVNAGALNAKKVTCPDVSVHVNAGSANLQIDGAKADYNITVDKNFAGCNLSSQPGATDKKLRVEVNAGSVDVNFTS